MKDLPWWEIVRIVQWAVEAFCSFFVLVGLFILFATRGEGNDQTH